MESDGRMEGEKEVARLGAPEVEECWSEPEMIPRSKSFSLTCWTLTCTSTRCCQIGQLMDDNTDSNGGVMRFMTFCFFFNIGPHEVRN